MRRPIIVANWKMHKTVAETREYIERFRSLIEGAEGAALAPPFTALPAAGQALQGSQIKLAAQNMHYAEQGAFTGEISPIMLCKLGCTYVIIGHSERRGHFHESDDLINQKLQSAFAHDLIPILCVGENLDERKAGHTELVLERQIRTDLEGLSAEDVGHLVIAYEPIWAIGTGQTASPDDAQAGARFIRERVAVLYGEKIADELRIQYGGSVNSKNAHSLLAQPDVDGALVGGASLDPVEFARIVKAAEAIRR
jgi:triosephosphate isomerase